jgi:hypothetical protein
VTLPSADSAWEERWPPERRIAFIRDTMPERYVELLFETMIMEGGGHA